MKARFFKLVGTLFIVFAMVALAFRIFGGDELSLMPWPVALIAIAIGAFLLKQGGGVEGWTGGTRTGAEPS